jgi:hypothetical protein
LVRNFEPTKKLAEKFRDLQSKAKKGCFVR